MPRKMRNNPWILKIRESTILLVRNEYLAGTSIFQSLVIRKNNAKKFIRFLSLGVTEFYSRQLLSSVESPLTMNRGKSESLNSARRKKKGAASLSNEG
jgi:hypothetical protein